jgi:hypothetical protein
MTESSQIKTKIEIEIVGQLEEIEPTYLGQNIGDLCTEMYHKVRSKHPVTAVANGVRIVMYTENELKMEKI